MNPGKASFGIIHGDCLDVMAGMDAGSVDAVVTDPPYGLEFMGMAWDKLDWRDGVGMSKCGLGDRATEWVSYGSETANATCAVCGGRMRGANKCSCESPEWRVKGEAYHSRNAYRAAMMQEWHQEWATEAIRVLKPSHYLLAFGGTRTWHRLACALEDAGFEIRDTLMWLYGTGFPKGDACLKPAWEPIILARKPGRKRELGIDACRIAIGGGQDAPQHNASGRWPANLVLECTCDKTLIGTVKTGTAVRHNSGGKTFGTDSDKPPMDDMTYAPGGTESVRIHTDPNCPCAMLDAQTVDQRGNGKSGGASRFFYCAKASRRERDAGLDGMDKRYVARDNGYSDKISDTKIARANRHPTVKPIALMSWLVRLVAQSGEVVLDPFMGSGTTGVACVDESRNFIGIEREAEYVEISRRRIEFASRQSSLPV